MSVTVTGCWSGDGLSVGVTAVAGRHWEDVHCVHVLLHGERPAGRWPELDDRRGGADRQMVPE